jgi:hypothetical protein
MVCSSHVLAEGSTASQTAIPVSAQIAAPRPTIDQSLSEESAWLTDKIVMILSLKRGRGAEAQVVSAISLDDVTTSRHLFRTLQDQLEELLDHDAGERIVRVDVQQLTGPTDAQRMTSFIMIPTTIEKDRSWNLVLRRWQQHCGGADLELEATVLTRGGSDGKSKV